MRVCVGVCVWGTTKGAGRGEKAKDDKATEMAKSGQRAGLGFTSPPPHLHLALPWLGWQMWNLWRAGQTHSTARTDVPSWQVMLARPLYIQPPFPSRAAHAYRLLPSAMYVYVGRSLASFLYAIEHTLMLYDVVMLVKMLVHTHTHTGACVCELPHATSHCLQAGGRGKGRGEGTRMYVNHMPWAIIAAATQPEIKQAKMLKML